MASSLPRAFSNPGWVFELKYDGVRALARGGRTAWLISRRGLELGPAFPEIVEALAELPPSLIDCELAVLDDAGRTSYEKLHRRCALRRPDAIAKAAQARPATLFAFDLLELRGKDLRARKLLERKATLEGLLGRSELIRYVGHVVGDGVALFSTVEAAKSEGIIAKRADSPYRAGKSSNWLKIKTKLGRANDAARAVLERR